eukprot:5691800-Prymnesium_polylepis.1
MPVPACPLCRSPRASRNRRLDPASHRHHTRAHTHTHPHTASPLRRNIYTRKPRKVVAALPTQCAAVRSLSLSDTNSLGSSGPVFRLAAPVPCRAGMLKASPCPRRRPAQGRGAGAGWSWAVRAGDVWAASRVATTGVYLEEQEGVVTDNRVEERFEDVQNHCARGARCTGARAVKGPLRRRTIPSSARCNTRARPRKEATRAHTPMRRRSRDGGVAGSGVAAPSRRGVEGVPVCGAITRRDRLEARARGRWGWANSLGCGAGRTLEDVEGDER